MAKTKTITVTYGRSTKLADFENARVEITEELEIEKGDDVNEIRAVVAKRIKRHIQRDMEELHGGRDPHPYKPMKDDDKPKAKKKKKK